MEWGLKVGSVVLSGVMLGWMGDLFPKNGRAKEKNVVRVLVLSKL